MRDANFGSRFGSTVPRGTPSLAGQSEATARVGRHRWQCLIVMVRVRGRLSKQRMRLDPSDVSGTLCAWGSPSVIWSDDVCTVLTDLQWIWSVVKLCFFLVVFVEFSISVQMLTWCWYWLLVDSLHYNGSFIYLFPHSVFCCT